MACRIELAMNRTESRITILRAQWNASWTVGWDESERDRKRGRAGAIIWGQM